MNYQAVITKLNLSTQPFRNRNLPYILALLLVAASALGAILSLVQLRRNTNDTGRILAQNQQMEDQIRQLKGKGEEVQQQLSPEQRALLIASHKLVANKIFSWSRLFSDLEAVLPGGVSASRINVNNVFSDGERTKADLELGVLSRDYQSVISMIDAMNNSGLFQAELKGQDLQKSERASYSEYTLHLIYVPAYRYPDGSSDIAKSGGADQ